MPKPTYLVCLNPEKENLNLLSNDTELALVQNDLPRFQERLVKLLLPVKKDKKTGLLSSFFLLTG